MATSELNFRNTGDVYEASYVSKGNTVVQLTRPTDAPYGGYLVYVNVEGMEKELIDAIQGDDNTIFEVDVPQGITVTIVSEVEVKQAKMSVA